MKYKVGLALSSGGTRCVAHCGAIQALEEFGFKPDIVSGSSAGSIVGALLCAGNTIETLTKNVASVEVNHLAKFNYPRLGFFSSEPLYKLLCEMLEDKNFEDLDIPMRVVATNLDSTEMVIFDSGNLARAIQASSAIPVIFNPVVIDGEYYVDGSLVSPLPVAAIRDMCEMVISIDLGESSAKTKKMNLMSILERSFYCIAKTNAASEAQMSDINIQIDTSSVNGSSFDFHLEIDIIKNTFRVGYESAVEQLETKYGLKRQSPSRLNEFIDSNSNTK